MELWGWLIGYVVLFALLHLLLYYIYVRREDSEGLQSPSITDPSRTRPYSPPGPDYSRASDGTADPEEREEEPEFDGEIIRCPHCGVRNNADQTYTYCWNCTSILRQ